MTFLYRIFIFFYRLAVTAAYPFSSKARLWIKGRRGLPGRIEAEKVDKRKVVWIHCSSLGEFEQGRPLIEKISNRSESYAILLTFFSPSGYEIRQNYHKADYIYYLPLDTRLAATQLVSHFNPVMAIFVKYEFWYFYIRELHNRNIPVYLVSALFRPSQVFFRRWGGWYCNMLRMFTHIFVQNSVSEKLLKEKGITNVSVAGDTRFDRVCSVASESEKIPVAEEFSCDKPVMVAGSTWQADEELLAAYINGATGNRKFIIAPHEVHQENLKRLMGLIKKPAVKYSEVTEAGDKTVLVIDNIGMLSSLYRYGSVAYIGGGFGKGIHNILEAAVYGMPVIFGPNYTRFAEAVELVKLGGAFPVSGAEELSRLTDRFFSDPLLLKKASFVAREYVKSGEGASDKILRRILPELY